MVSTFQPELMSLQHYPTMGFFSFFFLLDYFIYISADEMELKVSRWGSLGWPWPFLESLLHFFSCPLDRNNSGLKILRWVGGSIPQPGAMPKLWIWSIEVLSPL